MGNYFAYIYITNINIYILYVYVHKYTHILYIKNVIYNYTYSPIYINFFHFHDTHI